VTGIKIRPTIEKCPCEKKAKGTGIRDQRKVEGRAKEEEERKKGGNATNTPCTTLFDDLFVRFLVYELSSLLEAKKDLFFVVFM